MHTFLLVAILFAAPNSFAGKISEKTPLLQLSNQNTHDTYDHLTNLTLPVILEILDYIAADKKDGPKTIKALACTNKNFNMLCGRLDTLRGDFKRPKILGSIIGNNLPTTANNAQKLLSYAENNNLTELKSKVYNNMHFEPGCLDNCQDHFACVLPWQPAWDDACQESYKKRIKAKYGIELEQVTNVKDYNNYQESKKLYLGTGLRLVMCSARSFVQLVFCPICCCSTMMVHDSCHPNRGEIINFEQGETFCGWLHWPMQLLFSC